MEGKNPNANNTSSVKLQEEVDERQHCDPFEMSLVQTTASLDGPFMIPLFPVPNVDPFNLKASIVLTGTATRGGTGPAVGAVDIGASKYAYFFRVALPGVRKDPGRLIKLPICLIDCPESRLTKSVPEDDYAIKGLVSCEIERGGKVHVRGVTSTGGRTVLRHSRVYKMKFQQQCPPGPFTVSFSLPGPVDPRLFSPNFRSDGILEGVVMKYE